MSVWYRLMYGIACVVCSVTMICSHFLRVNAEGPIGADPVTGQSTVHEEGNMLPKSMKKNSDLTLLSDVRIESTTLYTSEPAEEIEEEPLVMRTFVVNGCKIADVYDDTEEGNVIGYVEADTVVTGTIEDGHLKMNCEEDAYIKMSHLVPYVSKYIAADTSDSNMSNDVFTYSTCIESSSGLSREDIRLLLKGTRLENSADTFYECEKVYGVNTFFALAVSKLESAWGTSQAGWSKNNLFGIMDSVGIATFSSLDACIEYWFELISGYYFENDMNSPASIGIVYCDSQWSPVIVDLMNEIRDKMESLKSTT